MNGALRRTDLSRAGGADGRPYSDCRSAGAEERQRGFLPGLGGDARGTWSAGTGDGVFWPVWLAQDIKGLSVYSVGYEAPVSGWHSSEMELADRATNVLNKLLVNTDLGTGKLILVGHSLGGLVIKQVLRKAADEATDRAEAGIHRARAQGGVSGDASYGGGLGGLGRSSACSISPFGCDPVASSQ